MIIKRTNIPARHRSDRLINTGGSGGASSGKSDVNHYTGSSHEHPNKSILDSITQEMLDNANREVLTTESDKSEATDDNLFSALATLAAIDEALEGIDLDEFLNELKQIFLRKDVADTAEGIITFVRGLVSEGAAEFVEGLTAKQLRSLIYIPGMLGKGYYVDEDGNATFDSITARKFAEFPEVRFNRTSVYTGIRWDTFGGGIVEKVDIDKDSHGNELQSGVVTLKLQDGEAGAIAMDDMCQGIFHSFGGNNDTVTEDQRNGNFRFMGFNTAYFRVTEVLEPDGSRFRYMLRGVSERWTQQHHPQMFMHFAAYANPTNPDRQASSYTTPHYTVRLRNMTTWEYGEQNIFEITGKLEGFEVGGEPLQGYGTWVGNMYFSGFIREIKNAPIEMKLDTRGDGFLALGETMVITCKVIHGWNDITDKVETWTVERESGHQADDNTWNNDHKDFAGVLTLTHTDEYSDLGGAITTYFVITAEGTTESGQAYRREIQLEI